MAMQRTEEVRTERHPDTRPNSDLEAAHRGFLHCGDFTLEDVRDSNLSPFSVDRPVDNQGRHQKRISAAQFLRRGLIDHVTVLDRANTASQRALDRGNGISVRHDVATLRLTLLNGSTYFV